MSKLSKAIKLAQGLTDEEKVEFAEFFAQEEEVEETEVTEEIKEEKKEKKQKEEPVIETKVHVTDDLKELFKTMQDKIEKLDEKITKQTPFGAKQKQTKGNEKNEFDDVFANLTSQQITQG